jgi:hypothetical protein
LVLFKTEVFKRLPQLSFVKDSIAFKKLCLGVARLGSLHLLFILCSIEKVSNLVMTYEIMVHSLQDSWLYSMVRCAIDSSFDIIALLRDSIHLFSR